MSMWLDLAKPEPSLLKQVREKPEVVRFASEGNRDGRCARKAAWNGGGLCSSRHSSGKKGLWYVDREVLR